jgi:hypothetical protein
VLKPGLPDLGNDCRMVVRGVRDIDRRLIDARLLPECRDRDEAVHAGHVQIDNDGGFSDFAASTACSPVCVITTSQPDRRSSFPRTSALLW